MINLRESFEVIAFQRDSALFKNLTTYFAALMQLDDQREFYAVLEKITAETLAVTGVWMEPREVESRMFFAPYVINVVIPDLNALTPLNRKAIDRLKNYDLDKLEISTVLNGTVDMKTGKVSGFFSKIRNYFDFSRSVLSGFFEADELAGLYLHEVAHAWTNYKYLGETMVTNVILAEVVGTMDVQTTVEKRYAVGLAALRMAGIEKRPPANVDSSEITALVLEGQVTRMAKEVGTRWYDRRLAEMLADQWAARWMIGSSLARALAKLERKKGIFAEAGYDPKWLGLASNLVNIGFLPFKTVSAGVSTLVLASLITVAKGFAWSFGLNAIAAALDAGAHNRVQDRVRSQRREIVTLLKDRELPKDILDTALAELAVIDEELDKVHEFSDVYGSLGRYVVGLFDGTRAMENELIKEELANNRLYEFSAKLRR